MNDIEKKDPLLVIHERVAIAGAQEKFAASFDKTLWECRPVLERPSVTLREWSIKQLSDGTAVIVGTDEVDGSGRVSSPIKVLDEENGHVLTESGRVYRLVGPTGYSAEGAYVWDRYKQLYKLREIL